MADNFSWKTRLDLDSKPAGIFTEETPFPITEASSDYAPKNDENPTGKTFTLGALVHVDGGYTGETTNGAFATPYKTIAAAVAATAAGNKTIVIRGAHDAFDGVYAEYVNFASEPRPGTDDTHRYMLVGYGQERPILEGASFGMDDNDGCGIKFRTATQYLTIQRLKVQNFPSRGILGTAESAVGNLVKPYLIDVWMYGNTRLNANDGNMAFYGDTAAAYVDSAWVIHCTSEHTYGKGFKVTDHTHNCVIEWNATSECGVWEGIPETAFAHPYGLDMASDGPTMHNYGAIVRYNVFGSALLGNEIRWPENISVHHNEFYDSVHLDQFPDHDTSYMTTSTLHLRCLLGTGKVYANVFRDNHDTIYPYLFTAIADTVSDGGVYDVYDNIFYDAAGTAKPGSAVWLYASGEAGNKQRLINFYNNSFYVNTSSGYALIQIDSPHVPDTNAFVLTNNIMYQAGAGACFKISGTDYSNITHTYNRLYFPSGSRGWTNDATDVEGNPNWFTLPVGAFAPASDCVLPATDAGADLSAYFTVDANGVTRSAWDKGAFEYIAGGAGAWRVYYAGNGELSGSVPTDASTYAQNAAVTVATNSGSLAKQSYWAFVGWNTAADGSGTSYAPGATMTMPGADVTLYAQWGPIFVLVT